MNDPYLRRSLGESATRNSLDLKSPLSAFDRYSLAYTNRYVRDFSDELSWRASYELLDRLLLSRWRERRMYYDVHWTGLESEYETYLPIAHSATLLGINKWGIE